MARTDAHAPVAVQIARGVAPRDVTVSRYANGITFALKRDNRGRARRKADDRREAWAAMADR